MTSDAPVDCREENSDLDQNVFSVSKDSRKVVVVGCSDCLEVNVLSRCLSFHTFPTDFETRRKLIYAIRRDHFAVSPHTRVCSRHFTNEDVCEPLSETARWLRKGAVPCVRNQGYVNHILWWFL
uniref:THAP-type domain-containing protein n=1 Tax=Labrus bergylta TaxID=56723 RepID=A0A3Q3EHT5_9LABR